MKMITKRMVSAILLAGLAISGFAAEPVRAEAATPNASVASGIVSMVQEAIYFSKALGMPASKYVKGSYFDPSGEISSTSKLKTITVSVLNSSGKQIQSVSVSPNAYSYNLNNSTIKNKIKLHMLGKGSYSYVIQITNTAGSQKKVSSKFNVYEAGNIITKRRVTNYKFNGKTYVMLDNASTYTGKTFCQFNSQYQKTFGNQGCSATSCATTISIMTSYVHSPVRYWKGGGCRLGDYGTVKSVSGQQKSMKQGISNIDNGLPSVIHIIDSKGKNGHFMTIVGYRSGCSKTNPKTSDILVIDSATGKITTLDYAMVYNYNQNVVESVRWFTKLK